MIPMNTMKTIDKELLNRAWIDMPAAFTEELYESLTSEADAETTETRIFLLLGKISRAIPASEEGPSPVYFKMDFGGFDYDLTAEIQNDDDEGPRLLIGFSDELRFMKFMDETAKIRMKCSRADLRALNPFADRLLAYARQARRDGILSLESKTEGEEDHLLKKGLELLLDLRDASEIESYFEKQTSNPEQGDIRLLKKRLTGIIFAEIQRGTNPQLIEELLGKITGDAQ